MKDPTDTGTNRTGVASASERARQLVEGAADGVPDAVITSAPLATAKLEIARNADPYGTVPPPATLKGAAKTMLKALKGQKANVLIDALGERLAYERTGVRLYEALQVKVEAADPHPGGPTRQLVQKIHDDELEHFQILARTLEALGADPTAVTPSANVMAVASQGFCQVLADPRSTLNECLKVILAVELNDNDSWQTLIELCSRMGQDELCGDLQRCMDQEDEHLVLVRSWVTRGLEGEAGLEPAPLVEASAP